CHRVVTARTQAVDVVGQPIDGDRVVPKRREPVRQPGAAGAEIERANRSLPDTGKRALLKVRVTFTTDAPFRGTRAVLRDDGQHAVLLRGRFAVAALGARGAVLPGERRRLVQPRPTQEAIDPFPAFVRLLARRAQERARGVLHHRFATLRAGKLRQPHWVSKLVIWFCVPGSWFLVLVLGSGS